jgi:hypothetical protein
MPKITYFSTSRISFVMSCALCISVRMYVCMLMYAGDAVVGFVCVLSAIKALLRHYSGSINVLRYITRVCYCKCTRTSMFACAHTRPSNIQPYVRLFLRRYATTSLRYSTTSCLFTPPQKKQRIVAAQQPQQQSHQKRWPETIASRRHGSACCRLRYSSSCSGRKCDAFSVCKKASQRTNSVQ